MDTSAFFKCQAFQSGWAGGDYFACVQNELMWSNPDGVSAIANTYRAGMRRGRAVGGTRESVLIIPSRDGLSLIDFTLRNLIAAGVADRCDIVVVDDRSTDDYGILLERFPVVSVLRVDNSRGFNFSMLCNLAVWFEWQRGVREVVFWNNDLWLKDVGQLDSLLMRHRQSGAVISGSKLLYPDAQMLARLELASVLPSDRCRVDERQAGRVQFGGAHWFRGEGGLLRFVPSHWRRFSEPSDSLVNCDRGETFVTGALQVVDAKWFIAVGGFNPSMCKNFQDTDLCLRARANGEHVMYFGRDLSFWHNESTSLDGAESQKVDAVFISDMALFGMIWNDRIESLVC
jgi:GT2 family glycosyltransferase